MRDRVNAEECHNFVRTTPPEDMPPYWFKNRFNACHGITLLSEHHEVRSGRPFLTGAMTVDAIVLGPATGQGLLARLGDAPRHSGSVDEQPGAQADHPVPA